MIVGLILLASVLGAVAAGTALVLGETIWLALLIYSGTGSLAVLAVAVAVALRPEAESRPATGSCALSRAYRG